MRFCNEFYLTKNEKLDYEGNIIHTYYTLRSFDLDKMNIEFDTFDEIKAIPFFEPSKFLDFVKDFWSEDLIEKFLKEEEYNINGNIISLKGVTYEK
ncbi:hypothetical protein [Niallia sp. FSL M8-0099]|uniref:hypothetical protein n=1 Tax=Niallia sp. FSL M8-0099 TaxID=2954519 RepID=UPI0030F9CBF5